MDIAHHQLWPLVIGIFSSGIFFFAGVTILMLRENIRAIYIPFALLTFVISWYYFWISIINAGMLPRESIFFGINLLFTGYGSPLVFLLTLSVISKTGLFNKKYYWVLLFGLMGSAVYILMHIDPYYYETAYNYYTQKDADYANILGYLYFVHSAIQACFLAACLFLLFRKILNRKISKNEKKPSYILLVIIIVLLITYLNSNILVYFFRFMVAKYIAPLVSLPIMAMLFYALMLNRIQVKKSQEILAKNNAYEQELQIARRIQQSIIPHENPENSRYQIASKYIPLAQVGGDFFDYIDVTDKTIGIFLADVSGHGIPAAFIASMIKIALTANSDKARKPDVLFLEISNVLRNNLKEHFFTANYAYLDFESDQMLIANAGHLPVLIHNKKTGELLEHNPRGTYVGPLFEKQFETHYLSFNKGDRIVLFTDGIVECHNADNKLFGLDRFKQLIRDSRELSVTKVSEKILSSLREWSSLRGGFDDDVTYIIVDIL